ncbi:hypothetical protein ACFPRL_06445 [Pseudoclavibacter helvolus]
MLAKELPNASVITWSLGSPRSGEPSTSSTRSQRDRPMIPLTVILAPTPNTTSS